MIMNDTKDLKQVIKDALTRRTPRTLEITDGAYTQAAVLLPLLRDGDEYKIIFTKRTDKVERHKGQISFPGGTVDEKDASFLDTALREADEEIGLARNNVEILGVLDDTATAASKFIIHPYVGLISHPYAFNLNAFEVVRLIEIPLHYFFAVHQAMGCGDDPSGRNTLQPPVFEYDKDVIWGATARITVNLVDVISENLPLPH